VAQARPQKIKALIAVEPTAFGDGEQAARLAAIPTSKPGWKDKALPMRMPAWHGMQPTAQSVVVATADAWL